MTHHRSRVLQFVIDVDDLDRGVAFWSAALDATEEPLSERSRPIYRLLRLPDAEIRVLLQRTHDEKVSKERMHLDLETDDIEAEVQRLEALGATRYDHQQERGFDFWVMRDPWGNEFCVLHPNFPELLARRRPWTTYRAPPSVLSLKNAASTVEGQKQMSLPPWGPVRKPWTAPGGIKTNVPGPTSSTGSASV
jgi:predicted enzyme related to lactoylglutathione lyase